MKELKDVIRNSREGLSLTQSQLANRWGQSPRSIAYYESGERTPDAWHLYKMWAKTGDECAAVVLSWMMPQFEAVLRRTAWKP